jgi:hypothetical protein
MKTMLRSSTSKYDPAAGRSVKKSETAAVKVRSAAITFSRAVNW